jgi:uncharacterized protein
MVRTMSPTNMLRRSPKAGEAPVRGTTGAAARVVLIRAGAVALRARLLATPTAGRIWAALPIYGTAETWGCAVHFETRVSTGREPGARPLVGAGEIAYWTEDDRIVIAFGPTPLSRPGEMRLPCPANIWAHALDDVAALAVVRPGERVAVLVAES